MPAAQLGPAARRSGGGGRRRALIAGSYGHGNIGDEAILLALVRGLRARRPDLELSVVAGDCARVRALVDAETVEWTDWQAIISTLRQADLLVQGGGGVFFDRGGFDAGRLLEPGASDLHHFASFPLLAQLLGKPLALLSCGVGPLASAPARKIVRACFEASLLATVRDLDSRDLLASLGVPVDRVRVTADLAFSLPSPGIPERQRSLAALGLPSQTPALALIPIRPDSGALSDAQLQQVGRDVGALAREAGCRLLVPLCHPSWDGPAVRLLRDCLPADLWIEATIESPEAFAAVLAGSELVVSMRLHGAILAALGGTPTVMIGSAPKLTSAANQLGLGGAHITPSDLDRLPIVLREAWATRNALRAGIVSRLPNLRRRAEENLDLACALVDLSPPVSTAPADFGWAIIALVERQLSAEAARLTGASSAEARGTPGLAERAEPAPLSPAEPAGTAEEEARTAKATIASLERERDELLRGLHQLESTKAVRLARMYWAVRSRLRGKRSQ